MTVIVGTSKDDSIFGSRFLSDWITGLAGNDTLSAGDIFNDSGGADTLDGGAGADLLIGVDGNDTYVIDNVADKIRELGSDANDRIIASIAIDLTASAAAYKGIEHVTLTGASALNATGNGAANMLIGNSGANILDGAAGNDTLIGGAGNDTYKVDSDLDVVVENPGEGVDTVISTAGEYILGAFIENLTLASVAEDGQGNALDNKITGNSIDNSLFGVAGNDTLTGNDGADTLDGGAGADSLVGGNGADSYFVDNVGDKISESGPASDVDVVTSAISFTLGANLEQLTLVGLDAIAGTGNALNNQLQGGSANNVLSGLAGDDTLIGFLGDDLLLGGDGNDRLKNGASGADTMVGGAGSDIFELHALGVVADFNGLLLGDQLDLSAFIGQPAAGSESLFIQTVTANGSTTVRVDQDGLGGKFAFVDLAVLQGVSTDIEGLLANGAIAGLATPATPAIDGTAGGDSLNGKGISDLMHGLAGNDTLTGNGGADTLDGGAGMDSLIGGAGNDTYVIDSVGDKIDESGGGTDDRIQATINIDLTVNAVAYAGIEHVTLTGASALNATGNGAANMLIGNDGANHLDGRGGDDTMIGGAGNDVYEVDSGSDQVIEFPNGGIDQVNSSVTFILGANIENLALTGSAFINGIGNELANKITGNAGQNILSGLDGNDTLIGGAGADNLVGGAGADSMAGGAGSDNYLVDNIGDKIMDDGPSTDFDVVNSTITYTLGATLEDLELGGFDNIDGTGNSLNNFISGNSGDNVLSGLAGNDVIEGNGGHDVMLGGDGSDTLRLGAGSETAVGGAGSDTFELRSLSNGNPHVIADFAGGPGGDLIDLRDVLGGFDFLSDNINDFLRTTTTNGNTTIQIDADGAANGANFVDGVVLQGVSTDLAGLITGGGLFLE